MRLDIPGNPLKLRVPENSPAIAMPQKEGEGSPQEITENTVQPEQVREPVRREDTSVPAEQGQTVFDSTDVADLQRQLAQRDRDLQDAQNKLKRQRALKAAQQKRYRQRHPEVGRRLNREWRARRRQNLSAESASEPPRLEQEAPASDPELAEQQRRRQRKAAYMREWRARRRQNPL